MSFLDNRQRAMLAEMGVRVWAPAVKQQRPIQEEPAAPSADVHARAAVAQEREITVVPAPGVRQAEFLAATQVPVRPVATPMASPSTGAAPAPRLLGVERMDWQQLQDTVAACQACGLCAGRTNTVFGVGSHQAEWMVVGEAPGENEDQQGEPFVGQAGKLLDNMLAAIGLSRQADDIANRTADQPVSEPARKGVYIANVLKCRPPGNRNPQPLEIVQCEPYLRRQVELLRPKVILAMGRFAVQSLLQTSEPIGRLRGRVHQYEGVPVIVTYHPAYLLRSLPEKAKAWDDLCLALEVAGGRPV